MKILDRYILKKFLSAFVFVMIIFMIVIIVIHYSENNDRFNRHELSVLEILGYYKNFIPYMANFLTPMFIFIAAVFTASKLASHTEVVAILSSGISFRRYMIPFLIGSVLVALVSFYLTGWVIPKANKDRIAFEIQYFESPYYYSEKNIHIKVAPRSYMYMESYNNTANLGYNFTLETISENELHEKLYARRIRWDNDSNYWVLNDWSYRKFDGYEEIVDQGARRDTVLNILPKDFENNLRLYETFTIDELNAYIRELRTRGADNIQLYEIEKYLRFMSPFAVIILTFIGVVVSSKKSRGGSGLRIAVGFLLAFIYIIFFVMSKAIAESGSLHPAIAVWVPNLAFITIGLLLYRFLPR